MVIYEAYRQKTLGHLIGSQTPEDVRTALESPDLHKTCKNELETVSKVDIIALKALNRLRLSLSTEHI